MHPSAICIHPSAVSQAHLAAGLCAARPAALPVVSNSEIARFRRNGTLVEGDMLVSGALSSTFNHTYVEELIAKAELLVTTNKEREQVRQKFTGCTPDRVGGLRWSSPKDLEGCSEEGEWRPILLCDRRCGFSQPPLPSIRPRVRGGEIQCQATYCPPACRMRGNDEVFPIGNPDEETMRFFRLETSTDVCVDLFNDYHRLNPNETGCRNLTAKDVIDHELTSQTYDGSAGEKNPTKGVDLLLRMSTKSRQLQQPQILDEEFSNIVRSRSSDVVICIAEIYANCTTYYDRETVCSREVDYFPFQKNPAIQIAATLYELTIDEVSAQTSMLACVLAGSRALPPLLTSVF
jgi:hypothetical protein